MKKYFLSLSLFTFSLSASPAKAECNTSTQECLFEGGWTEEFKLKGGSFIRHTPDLVSLDNMMTSGKALSLKSKSFNGVSLLNGGLFVRVDSTREEFVANLTASGLYPR